MILEKETTAGEAAVTGQQTCKTCGHAFAGRYCNQCGEKVIEPRDLSVRHYLEDIFNAFTSLDAKVWRTVRLVAQAPGGLSRAYMEGRRIPYLKPVSIFFLANLIYFLLPFFKTFNTRLDTQLSGRPYSNYTIGDIVFCKVKGRYIDAHKIVAVDANRGYLIANNHGFENGWTKQIFGRAVRAEFGGLAKDL